MDTSNAAKVEGMLSQAGEAAKQDMVEALTQQVSAPTSLICLWWGSN